MKENEQVEWNGVKRVKAGVAENERCKQNVALLMNEEWYEGIHYFKCIDSRYM